MVRYECVCTEDLLVYQVCTPSVLVHTEYVVVHLLWYVMRHSIGRCCVAVLIWIHSAWIVQRLLSTVFALRGLAPRADVLTVSWAMDIAESASTAGWQW